MYEFRIINKADDQTLGTLNLHQRRRMDIRALVQGFLPAVVSRSIPALLYAAGISVASLVVGFFALPILLFVFDFSTFMEFHDEVKQAFAALLQVGVAVTPEQEQALWMVSTIMQQVWMIVLLFSFSLRFFTRPNADYFSKRFHLARHAHLCGMDDRYQDARFGDVRFEDNSRSIRGTDAGKRIEDKLALVILYGLSVPIFAVAIPLMVSENLSITSEVMEFWPAISWVVAAFLSIKLAKAWQDYTVALERIGEDEAPPEVSAV